eukprot:ANDGO_05194.mRNA.1 hypothetical protein SPRG_11768
MSSQAAFGIVNQLRANGISVEPSVVQFIYDRLSSNANETLKVLMRANDARKQTFRMQEVYTTTILNVDKAAESQQAEFRTLVKNTCLEIAALNGRSALSVLENFVGSEYISVVGDALSTFDPRTLSQTANLEKFRLVCIGLRGLENGINHEQLANAFQNTYATFSQTVDKSMFDLQRMISNYECVLNARDILGIPPQAMQEELYNRVQLIVCLRDAKSLADAAHEDLAVAKNSLDNLLESLTPDSKQEVFHEIGKRYDEMIHISPLLQKAVIVARQMEQFLQFDSSLQPSLVEKAFEVSKSLPVRKPLSEQAHGSDSKGFAERTPFNGKRVQLNGFDAVELVDGRGVLLSGSPDFCVRYADGLFLFSSSQNADSFCAAPAAYLDAVLAEAFEGPELIILLGLSSLLPLESVLASVDSRVGSFGQVGFSGTAPPKKVDMGTETPVHFVERHIDPKYTFSEWELRRRALQMADLRNKRTKGLQTNKSHFRRENESQVYLPKAQAVQTAKESGTQGKKTVRYIGGLRGDKDTKMNVVTLEIDL